MAPQVCWPTCHRSARDADTANYLVGTCAHNRRLHDKQESLPNTLLKCSGCNRRTCFVCLSELKKQCEKIVTEFTEKGMVYEYSPTLEGLLSGDLVAPDKVKSEAVVGKTVSICLWCHDERVPQPAAECEPSAYAREIGLDQDATYATSPPRIVESYERSAEPHVLAHRPPPQAYPLLLCLIAILKCVCYPSAASQSCRATTCSTMDPRSWCPHTSCEPSPFAAACKGYRLLAPLQWMQRRCAIMHA